MKNKKILEQLHLHSSLQPIITIRMTMVVLITAVLIMDPILLIPEMEKTWAGPTKCCKYRK